MLCAAPCSSLLVVVAATRHPKGRTSPILPSLPNRDASTVSGMSFVFIKREGHPDERFVDINIDGLATISQLAKRACDEMPYWNANAGQVTLFLVPKERELALDAGDPEVPGDFVTRLLSSTTVTDAVIPHRSFLLARLPAALVPAPAPGKSTPLALHVSFPPLFVNAQYPRY